MSKFMLCDPRVWYEEKDRRIRAPGLLDRLHADAPASDHLSSTSLLDLGHPSDPYPMAFSNGTPLLYKLS